MYSTAKSNHIVAMSHKQCMDIVTHNKQNEDVMQRYNVFEGNTWLFITLIKLV